MIYLALSVAKFIALFCVIEIFTNMEQWWNDTDRRKRKFSKKSLSQTTLFTTSPARAGLGLNQASTVRCRRLTS